MKLKSLALSAAIVATAFSATLSTAAFAQAKESSSRCWSTAPAPTRPTAHPGPMASRTT